MLCGQEMNRVLCSVTQYDDWTFTQTDWEKGQIFSILYFHYLNGGGPGGDSCRGPTTPNPMFVFDKLIACELVPLVDNPCDVGTEPFDNTVPGGSWVGEFLRVLALCIGDNCFPWACPVTNVSCWAACVVDGPVVPYNDVGILDVEAPTVAWGSWGGELAVDAAAVTSCADTDDVEGNKGTFLLGLSWLVLSLYSLGSLCFFGSLNTSFVSDFLDSLSRCSLLSRCSWIKKNLFLVSVITVQFPPPLNPDLLWLQIRELLSESD